MRVLKIFLYASFIGCFIFYHLNRPTPPRLEPDLSKKVLKEVFLLADAFSKKEGSPPHYKVYRMDKDTAKHSLVGIILETFDLAPEETGYSGPIKMLLGVDLKGKIVGLKILEHQETQAYVRGIEQKWFLDQYLGKSYSEPFLVDKDIDGLSSATVTVEGINRTIKRSLLRVAEEILTVALAEEAREKITFDWREAKNFIIYFYLLILIFALTNLFIRKFWFGDLTLILSFLILGLYSPNFFSIVHVSGLAELRFPLFSAHIFFYIFLIFIILGALIFGRIYCGLNCPFGALQEFLNKVVPFKIDLEKSWHKKFTFIKFLLLWLLISLSLLMVGISLENYEPFSTLFLRTGTFASWLLVIFALFFASFIPRFWCRYFCVAGGFLGLIGEKSILKIRMHGSCQECMACETICPTTAFKSNQGIDRVECISCLKCLKTCAQLKKNNLKYGLKT